MFQTGRKYQPINFLSFSVRSLLYIYRDLDRVGYGHSEEVPNIQVYCVEASQSLLRSIACINTSVFIVKRRRTFCW